VSVFKSKNDAAWELLFDERDVLSDTAVNGIHRLRASAIIAKREADGSHMASRMHPAKNCLLARDRHHDAVPRTYHQ
jgi:hypothetical protein